ncbi:MAG: DNA topoisomerase IB, partial [Chitinophagaceae bacterium]
GTFVYFNPDGEKITDKETLERFRKLVIPPAWTDVWICPNPKGHLQVTGRDAKGRKQYRYHPDWSSSRNANKFSRMGAFAELLPDIRKNIEKDINRPHYDRRKITATVLRLIDTAHIRVGNKAYAKANKSFGLTTLRDRHVKINGSNIKLQFTGKKGVAQDIHLQDRKLAKIVQKCKDIPGQDLFQYFDDEGNRQTIESGDVNNYLREVSGLDFTAKDFRTWAGTVQMIKCLHGAKIEAPEGKPENYVKEAVKEVASRLGNTPTVCSKYYIHPEVATYFKDGKLESLIKKAEKKALRATGMECYELAAVLLLKELEKNT